MVQSKISQLAVAAGFVAASVAGLSSSAHAAPADTKAAVACVNGDGVMDLTLSNSAVDASAEFTVTHPETFESSSLQLVPGESQVMTLDGLSDGNLFVPVVSNGTDQSVSTNISCDAPACAEGALTNVTDDNGVQHQACVASAVAVPPATSAKATFVPPAYAGPVTTPAVLPATGSRGGGLLIAALLVGCGSVASLLSRRRS